MGKQSLRSIASELDISHSTLSKIANGKYKADPKNIVQKLLNLLGGVHLPEDKYDQLIEMLDNARFPAKFQQHHRTAAWLYNLISSAKKRSSDVPIL